MRHRDSIIDEIHRLRERIGRAHGFDPDRIALTIRQHEREAGRPVVDTTPWRTKATARLQAALTGGASEGIHTS